jgi:hypothetical protein
MREVVALARDLRDGEVRELDLDLTPLLTTRLECQLRLDGVPCAGAWVILHGEDPARRGEVKHSLTVTCDAEGRFATTLPPGLYGIWVKPLRSGPVPLPCVDPVLVESGQTAQRAFDLRALRVHLRLLDADGAPVADRDVQLNLPPYLGGLRTDGEGRITIDPAPDHPFRLSTRPDHAHGPAPPDATRRNPKSARNETQVIDLGQVTPLKDRDELTLELRLPR